MPLCLYAQVTTLYQSAERALAFSPQRQAMVHNNQAMEHDLKQARARYGPSVDLLLGYGAGQHSDSVTRLQGADPSDSDLNSRGDATLRLTQKVYDGGETRQTISIRQAVLESARHGLKEVTQAIVFDAISAHLDVYRYSELVALAKKDFQVHQDIFHALSDIEQAGTGNIADVTQTQTRMARARSVLISSQSDLRAASAYYERVVGTKPEALAFAGLPEAMPASLDDALVKTEQSNPGLLAINAILSETQARVDLARSAYKPKFNIELNSRYNDHLDGDPSWQHTNEAMLVMRWNLFNGGQDKQGVKAALSRNYQNRLKRDDKLMELRESTAATWATFLSLQEQKKAHRDAVALSEKTFDAYLKQFSVSRRNLLDVLNAEKEYFQSARQLVDVSVDEIISAYRILSLTGKLKAMEISDAGELSTDLSRLAQAIELPSAAISPGLYLPTTPYLPSGSSDHLSAAAKEHLLRAAESEPGSPAKPEDRFLFEIGPCITTHELKEAKKILRGSGVDFQQILGSGMVKFTRLREGLYTADEAHRRFEELKKASIDAFVLKENKRFAIYVGSFYDPERVRRHTRWLETKKIAVTPVVAEVQRKGSMLIVQSVDGQTAAIISKQLSGLGVTTKTTYSHHSIKY